MAEMTSEKILIPETFQGPGYDIAAQIGLMWELIKAPLIVPLLKLGVYICLAMSLMLFMERLYMGVVIILVKLFWKKPEKRYKYEIIQDDVELGSSNFPVVLIQIPMFNEKEVRFCLLFFFFFLLCLSFQLVYVLGFFVEKRKPKIMVLLLLFFIFMGFWVRFTRYLLVLHVGFHGRRIVS